LAWADSLTDSSALTTHIMGGGTLEVGDRGPEVTDLQEMLGFNNPDGAFGPMTLQQLALFQGAYGLTASGLLDLQTYARLSEVKNSGSDPHGILFGQVGRGASRGTARQDNLPAGMDSSQKMAKHDEDRVMQHKSQFIEAAARYDIPPALLAAIASRETRGGSQLGEDGYSIYGGNQGFGLMQVDAGHHTPAGGPTSSEHIEQAAGILVTFRNALASRNPDWTEAQTLKAAVAAYNCGSGRVRSIQNMDGRTTGGDYSNDTWVRAQYYARFFNEGMPNS